MSAEIIRYRISTESAQAFEDAYHKAEAILQEMKHYEATRIDWKHTA